MSLVQEIKSFNQCIDKAKASANELPRSIILECLAHLRNIHKHLEAGVICSSLLDLLDKADAKSVECEDPKAMVDILSETYDILHRAIGEQGREYARMGNVIAGFLIRAKHATVLGQISGHMQGMQLKQLVESRSAYSIELEEYKSMKAIYYRLSPLGTMQ